MVIDVVKSSLNMTDSSISDITYLNMPIINIEGEVENSGDCIILFTNVVI